MMHKMQTNEQRYDKTPIDLIDGVVAKALAFAQAEVTRRSLGEGGAGGGGGSGGGSGLEGGPPPALAY